jgi:hypothetical protein
MIHRFASLTLIIALVCTVGGTAAFANTPTGSDTSGVVTLPASPTSAKKELPSNEKLQSGLARLVADTKAGKGKLSEPSQFQAPRGNNLSKNQKIALGVGIAAVVVLVIVVIHAKNHLFDDFNLSNTR